MCLLCVEVLKEKLSAKDFWRNYREMADEEHREVVIKAVTKTSYEYQAELANSALDDSDDE